MLRELNVVEQGYRAVLEVLSGIPVVEVAERYGVARQTVHRWMARYEADGIPGLADRSHAPKAHPWRIAADVEAVICELRRAHRRWGPRRLVFELDRRGYPAVSRSTGSWSAISSSSRSPGAGAASNTCAGSARSRWTCGSWMSPRACSWLTAASARSSTGSMTIPASASLATSPW